MRCFKTRSRAARAIPNGIDAGMRIEPPVLEGEQHAQVARVDLIGRQVRPVRGRPSAPHLSGRRWAAGAPPSVAAAGPSATWQPARPRARQARRPRRPTQNSGAADRTPQRMRPLLTVCIIARWVCPGSRCQSGGRARAAASVFRARHSRPRRPLPPGPPRVRAPCRDAPLAASFCISDRSGDRSQLNIAEPCLPGANAVPRDLKSSPMQPGKTVSAVNRTRNARAIASAAAAQCGSASKSWAVRRFCWRDDRWRRAIRRQRARGRLRRRRARSPAAASTASLTLPFDRSSASRTWPRSGR